MPGAWTTLTMKDGTETSRTVPVWDIDGAGTGGYIFSNMLVNPDGDVSVISDLGQVRTILETAAGVAVDPVAQVAHAATDSGEPTKVGAKAVTGLSTQTLVADDERTNLFAGIDGALIVRPHCCLEDIVSEVDTNTDGASTAFASGLAAPGTGIKLYITSVTIANSSNAFCTVDLENGSGGSVLWTLPVPATGGVTHTFNPPLPLSANTALAYNASAATTTLTISAIGFKSKI